MWAIIKFDKKKLNILKKDFSEKLGEDFNIYSPKIFIQKYKNNKLINKEFSLLGDYLFCYHKKFSNPKTISRLKFVKGLKYFLTGFMQSQGDIKKFIEKCKEAEDQNGYLSQNFFKLSLNSEYKFYSGPFTDIIFKIVDFQKNKINILVGNIKTSIKSKDFLFYPV